MDAQLQQIIELQTEQNQLLKRYLWRFRFSLITLLLLTTIICCCLGFVIYTQQKVSRTAPIPAGITISPYIGPPPTILPQSVPADADPDNPFK